MPQSWLALPSATRAEGGDRSFALLLDDWCRAFDRSASGRSGAYAGACAFRSPCGPRYAGARSSDGGQRKACRGPPRRSAASARDSGPYHPAVCGKTTTEGSTAERAAGQSTGAVGRVRPCRASLDGPKPRLSSQERVGHRLLSVPGMQIQDIIVIDDRRLAATAFKDSARAIWQRRFPLIDHRRMHTEQARQFRPGLLACQRLKGLLRPEPMGVCCFRFDIVDLPREACQQRAKTELRSVSGLRRPHHTQDKAAITTHCPAAQSVARSASGSSGCPPQAMRAEVRISGARASSPRAAFNPIARLIWILRFSTDNVVPASPVRRPCAPATSPECGHGGDRRCGD